jgi:aspartyl-tRNA synthetase
MLRTNTCGELNKRQVGKKITLCGWVNSRRDHGGIIFIDLRDRYGLTQIKFDPRISQESWNEADKVRPEWVLKVTGEVLARPKDMINKNLATGEVEVAISEIEILTQSKTPPFEIDQDKNVNEDLRLKYRFLDLRHRHLQKIMADRDKLITYVREYFHKKDFLHLLL